MIISVKDKLTVPLSEIRDLLDDLKIHGYPGYQGNADYADYNEGVNVIAWCETLISNTEDEAEHPEEYAQSPTVVTEVRA